MSPLLAYLFYLRHSRGKEKGQEEKKLLEKRWDIRVFPDVNIIGRPKAVTAIPILLIKALYTVTAKSSCILNVLLKG